MTKLSSTKAACLIALALTLILGPGAFAGQTEDVIFRAMQDELQRNMSQLVMAELEHPYFVSYTIDDYQNLTVIGSLGTLTQSRLDRGRYLTVDLRVGDYNLDNSNFVSGYYDPGASYFPISVEDDYDAVRNQIYLATDELYKGALKELSRKRAYLQTRVIKDRPADFLKEPPNVYLGRQEAFDMNQPYFNELVLSASRVFRDYPMIVSSRIKLTAGMNNQYFVNSSESRSLRGERVYVLELAMSGKSPEGEDITDSDRMIVKDLKDIPDVSKLTNWARDNAERMKQLVAANTIEEYTGPVLFTGDAAGEFFRQLFVENISESPSPLYEKEEVGKNIPGPELANKVKRRVLPEFIDVYDDPTQSSIGHLTLVGGFAVDDAGNVPVKIQLVDHGKLVDLPIGVAPTKQINRPNGHARGAVSKRIEARPGNVIVESSDTATISQLRQSMLQLCQDMGLDYGLVIRKLETSNEQSGGFMYFFGPQSGRPSPLSVPLEAYKVYSDGTEEAVRSLEFSNVTVRMLKDILQTDDSRHCYSYLIENDNEMPVSIVCPSVLVEEMELKKIEAKNKKPPVLPSPLSKR